MKRARLAPRGAVRRHQQTVHAVTVKRYWRQAVVRGGCAMCRHEPVTDPALRRDHGPDLRRLEGHHILSQHDLARLNFTFEEIWDERNGLCLCRYHHERHERWRQRVPRAVLPAVAYEYARERKIEWLLDREYPPE